jgi:glycolate oxidase
MFEPRIVVELRNIVGADGVIDKHEQLRTYESDGLTNFRIVPALVVFPTSTEQVQAIVRVCHREHIPFVPRGSGTGLSGGVLPVASGIVISLARVRQIIKVDLPNQRVVVQPGVINLWITQRIAPHGYYYAPDPSSQQVCSIGGNVAENSGGAHCLKYGFTVHHVLGIEAVLSNGDLVQLDSAIADAPGPDLLGVLIGSEGTLAVVTKVTVRILRRPEAVQTLLAAYDSIGAAGTAVS